MKTATVVIVIFVTVLVVGLVAYALWPSSGPAPTDTTPTTQGPSGGYQSTVTPGGSGTQEPATPNAGRVSVPTSVGTTVEVADITTQEGVEADSENPGLYYVSARGATATIYTISFDSVEGSYTVALFAEPLGNNRLLAEQDLLQRLDIAQDNACLLRYAVLTTASVNPLYAGKNLGFSFCPGATPL